MVAHPLFVVGSPRSGTSILVRALQRAGYGGYNEGNFLSVIHALLRDIDRHFTIFGSDNPHVLTAHVDREALKESVARAVVEAALPHYATTPWLDKTGNPEMIEIIPVIRKILPTSRFLFAKRRALENIVSRLQKFPKHNFEYHCTDWSNNMAAWRRLLHAYPDLPAIEVDQYDIGESPAETAQMLARFLELPPEGQQILEQTFRNDRPQQSNPGSARRVLNLESTGWTPQQVETFQARCGEQMRAYGYSTDSAYRLDSPIETVGAER